MMTSNRPSILRVARFIRRVTLMPAYLPILCYFPIFGLPMAVLALTRLNSQQLAYSPARHLTLPRRYLTGVPPTENR